MRSVFSNLLIALLLTGPVSAADKPMTVGDVIALGPHLRSLDGRLVVVKQKDGVDGLVLTPWDFASGTLRLRIGRNLTAVMAVEREVEDARQAIVKEVQSGLPAGQEIANGTPEWDRFQKQMTELMKQPSTVRLDHIKASELKLDKNEIPATTLSGLAPIMDDDVSGK
jgi:hypothetical protein